MQIVFESRDAEGSELRDASVARVRFALRRLAGTVVIASLASDWRTALDRSLVRATRVLTRSLQRANKPVRGRAARLALDS